MKTWSNGTFIEGKAPSDTFLYPLHYGGPVVWEGIRSYIQDDGKAKIFKLKQHVQRLKESAKILGVNIPLSNAQIEQACEALVQQNGNKDFYLRPIAYLKTDAEGIRSEKRPKELTLDIYCVDAPKLKDPEKGIKMIVSNVVRGYPQHTMQAKTPANYSVITEGEPLLEQTGADDIFVLDNQGYVVEATCANFFVVKGDVIMTPPNCGSILPGITRRAIAELLNDVSIKMKHMKFPTVVEKNITKADLYTADCVFLCGTYVEVMKVREIDGRPIEGDDSYFKIVRSEYINKVRGRS